MSDDLDNLAGGLAGRLRLLMMALDRLDRLEAGTGEWRAGFAGGELDEAATELTLRGLRTAADAANFGILKLLAASASLSLGDLIAATDLGRLVLSERLNDLVQVGLASRLIDTDHAQITAAGAAMVSLIGGIAAQVAADFSEREEL